MLYWSPHFKPHTGLPLGQTQDSGFPPLPCANKLTSYDGILVSISGGVIRNWSESSGLIPCW